MSKDRYALTFDEMARARHFFNKHADEYITQEFQMRTMLSEMGQYPPSTEINFCLEQFEGKMNFNNFCNYCCYLKKKYSKPEPKDVDTLRAFVALGGTGDRSGDISTDKLRGECDKFHLTIDLDAMLREVDEDGSGAIDYSEFSAMWLLGMPGDEIVQDDAQAENAAKVGGGAEDVLAGSFSRKGSSVREEALDEDDSLQVVRGFLFPLQRQSMAASNLDLLDKQKRKASRKSIVKLPPLGGMASSTRKANFDIGEPMVEEEELPVSGLKPAPPPQAQTARQSVAGFVPPSPTILDFRGGRSLKKKGGSTRAKSSPRKPASARGPSKHSRLY